MTNSTVASSSEEEAPPQQGNPIAGALSKKLTILALIVAASAVLQQLMKIPLPIVHEVRTKLLVPHNPLPKDVHPKRITVQLCIACSGAKHLQSMTGALFTAMSDDDGFELKAMNYQPAPLYQLLSNASFVIQAILMVFIFFFAEVKKFSKTYLPARIAEPVSSVLTYVGDRRLQSFLWVFLVGSISKAMLSNRNAFEVFVGEELVWSKLQSNQLPTVVDMVNLYRNHTGNAPMRIP